MTKGAITMDSHETFSFDSLNPKVVRAFRTLADAVRAQTFEIGGVEHRFEPFEGFRHPLRQHYLLTRTKTTKAGPWQSAHQYGVAIDFACRRIDEYGSLHGWFWPDLAPWDMLKERAIACGLAVPILWDKGHVVHPLWFEISKVVK